MENILRFVVYGFIGNNKKQIFIKKADFRYKRLKTEGLGILYNKRNKTNSFFYVSRETLCRKIKIKVL